MIRKSGTRFSEKIMRHSSTSRPRRARPGGAIERGPAPLGAALEFVRPLRLLRALLTLALAMPLDGEAATFAVGERLGARLRRGRLGLLLLVTARTMVSAPQRLWRVFGRRAPGM